MQLPGSNVAESEQVEVRQATPASLGYRWDAAGILLSTVPDTQTAVGSANVDESLAELPVRAQLEHDGANSVWNLETAPESGGVEEPDLRFEPGQGQR
jgi:hypothetical protein